MVCLGNICRSPLAHGILEHKAKLNSLDISVDSAGTGTWHIGNKPDERSIEIAKKKWHFNSRPTSKTSKFSGP